VQFFDSITIKKLMDWILSNLHAVWWLEIFQFFLEFFDRWIRLKVKSDFHGIKAKRAVMMNSAESGSVWVEALRISATNAILVRVMPNTGQRPHVSGLAAMGQGEICRSAGRSCRSAIPLTEHNQPRLACSAMHEYRQGKECG
jgi:hypothetical protein